MAANDGAGALQTASRRFACGHATSPRSCVINIDISGGLAKPSMISTSRERAWLSGYGAYSTFPQTSS